MDHVSSVMEKSRMCYWEWINYVFFCGLWCVEYGRRWWSSVLFISRRPFFTALRENIDVRVGHIILHSNKKEVIQWCSINEKNSDMGRNYQEKMDVRQVDMAKNSTMSTQIDKKNQRKTNKAH